MTPEQIQSAREWAEHEHPMSYTLPADRFGGPDTFLRCPKCEQWSPCYVRMILSDLDAALAERDRLRLVVRVLARLVQEEYGGSLVDIASTWGSASDEELAALRATEEITE